MLSKIRNLPQNSQLCGNAFFKKKIRSKVKNRHISEAGVSFEIQFGQFIKKAAGKQIFYIWQEAIPLGIEVMKPLDNNNVVSGQAILLMKFLDTLFQMPKREFGLRWEKIKVIRVKRNIFINDLKNV